VVSLLSRLAKKTRSTAADVAGMLNSLLINGCSDLYFLLAMQRRLAGHHNWSSVLIAARYLFSVTSAGTSPDSLVDASVGLLERWYVSKQRRGFFFTWCMT